MIEIFADIENIDFTYQYDNMGNRTEKKDNKNKGWFSKTQITINAKKQK